MAGIPGRPRPPGRRIRAPIRQEGRRGHDARPLYGRRGDTLEMVVKLMERHRIKRLPVVRDGRMVGIISRANLLHALATSPARRRRPPPTTPQSATRFWRRSTETLGDRHQRRRQGWHRGNLGNDPGRARAPSLHRRGREHPGVKQVHDHMVWVEPMSGMAFSSSEEDAR